MPHTIPASFVMSAVNLAVRKGWDIDALLAEAAISPMQIVGARKRLSDDQVRRLSNAAWRMTDDDLLGVGPLPLPRGTLRMICFAMASVSDLEHALTRFAEFTKAVPGLPDMRLQIDTGDASVIVDTSGLDDPDQFLTICTMAAVHRIIGWAIGKQVPVRRIELPFPEPEETADLELLFAEPLVFDAAQAALIMDAHILRAPVQHDENSLIDYLRRAPTALLSRRNEAQPISQRVRKMIEKRLTEHESPTAEELAAYLLMSTPTLRRKLRDEGTSVREVREEILCRSAISSLERGQEPVAALSERLGFSEPSAFTRAFRRWTGHSPSSYRNAQTR